jgi:hypothetical protein
MKCSQLKKRFTSLHHIHGLIIYFLYTAHQLFYRETQNLCCWGGRAKVAVKFC